MRRPSTYSTASDKDDGERNSAKHLLLFVSDFALEENL
jgi:hypothetical protein